MPLNAIIDIESRSAIDLKETGIYPYAAHPTTDLWVVSFGLCEGRGPLQFVHSWHPGSDKHAGELDYILSDPSIRLYAHNAQFERVMLANILTKRYGFAEAPLDRWYCTLAMCANMGLPRGLGQAGQALGLQERKDNAGHRLMLRMARPRATLDDGSHTWWDDADKVERLTEYCEQDVVAEHGIFQMLPDITASERRIYLLDQTINDRGIGVDNGLIEGVESISQQAQASINEELSQVSEGRVSDAYDRNSMLEAMNWAGVETNSLAKQNLFNLIRDPSLPETAEKIINLRLQGAKTSVAKTKKFKSAQSTDCRIRGMLQYFGAQTGRFSSRLVMVHNLPARSKQLSSDFDAAKWIEPVKQGNEPLISAFHPPMEVAAMMLRPCLAAQKGSTLMGADFSSIELRTLAYMADEQWLLDAYRKGDDPYRMMAADIYGGNAKDITKGSRERFVGKSVSLGGLYGLGAKGFRNRMAEDGVDLLPEEAESIIGTYRAKNQSIVALWRELEKKALKAVKEPGTEIPAAGALVKFKVYREWLLMILPGRKRALAYYKPRIKQRETPWGEMRDAVAYFGQNTYTRQWGWVDLHAPRITENLNQAVARDVLVNAMFNLEAAGFPVVFTVHDEIICEVGKDSGLTGEGFISAMTTPPTWMPALPLEAEAWAGEHYQK